MPTYTVTDPQSGKTVKLTGSSPPGEQELNDIFSRVSQPSMLGMAGQAIGQTLTEDLPGVGGAVGALRTTIPNAIGSVGNAAGIPNLGTIAGGPIRGVGEMLPKTGLDLALNAAGPLLESGAALARGSVGIGRTIIPKISSALTREELPIVERWISRSSQIGKKLKTPLDADVTEQIVTRLKDAVKEARSSVGRILGKVEDAVAARSTKMIPTGDLGNNLAKDLANAGFDVQGYTGAEVTKKLSPKTADIINDFKNLENKLPDIASGLTPTQSSQPMSFKGVLNLRRKIDQIVEFRPNTSMTVDSVEEAILKKYRAALNQRLLQSERAFAAANGHFAKVAQVYKQLKDDVLSGKAETVSNRIARIFKKGTVERKVIDKMDEMGQQATGHLEDLLDTFSAQRAKPRVNPALGKAVFATGGGLIGEAARLSGASSPEALAAGAAGLAASVGATSPRLNFRVLQVAKEIGKALSKVGLGPTSQLAASLSAPAIHDAILNHAMDQHLNAPPNP